jgi:hypothetical protein
VNPTPSSTVYSPLNWIFSLILLRALVSFPGSGNSWLRYLIECATGVFTGSVYHDRIIYSSGLLGECRPPNDGSTIVQKTHHDTTFLSSHRTRQAYIKLTELMFGYRGILLIRNPYDALVSYWNFMHSKSNDRHRGFASQQNFSESGTVSFPVISDTTTVLCMYWSTKRQNCFLSNAILFLFLLWISLCFGFSVLCSCKIVYVLKLQ